jgi:hypothetical protein
MAILQTNVDSIIAQAQRAMADIGYDIAVQEKLGENPISLYKKNRFLSTGIKVLNNSVNGLTANQKRKIISCLIKEGELSKYSSTPLSFTPMVINQNNISSEGLITIENTVFVSKNGNDSTGMIERLDKPFFTWTAAINAAKSAYTISTTNRILIRGFSGYYNEGIILENGIDLDLGNCVIERTSGNYATLDDNNVAVDCVIYGGGIIKRSGTGSNAHGVYIQHSNSVINFTSRSVESSVGDAIKETGTNVFRTTINTSGGNGLYTTGGITHYFGNIKTTATTGIAARVSGEQHLYGNIISTSANSSAHGIQCDSGVQMLHGNITTGGGIGQYLVAGYQNIWGNIVSGGGVGMKVEAGTQGLTGYVTVTSGTGIIANGGSQDVFGYVINNAGAIGAQCNNSGTYQKILLGIICYSSTAKSAQCNGGQQDIKGILYSIGTGASIGAECNGGIQNIAAEDVLCFGNASGAAFTCNGGVQKYFGSNIKSGYPNVTPGYKTGGALVLKNCSIYVNGTANCITAGSAQDVVIYGGNLDSNKNANANITFRVGSITVDPTYVIY